MVLEMNVLREDRSCASEKRAVAVYLGDECALVNAFTNDDR